MAARKPSQDRSLREPRAHAQLIGARMNESARGRRSLMAFHIACKPGRAERGARSSRCGSPAARRCRRRPVWPEACPCWAMPTGDIRRHPAWAGDNRAGTCTALPDEPGRDEGRRRTCDAEQDPGQHGQDARCRLGGTSLGVAVRLPCRQRPSTRVLACCPEADAWVASPPADPRIATGGSTDVCAHLIVRKRTGSTNTGTRGWGESPRSGQCRNENDGKRWFAKLALGRCRGGDPSPKRRPSIRSPVVLEEERCVIDV